MGKIELLRKKLNRLVEKEEELTSSKVVKLSQELDMELNKHINKKIEREH